MMIEIIAGYVLGVVMAAIWLKWRDIRSSIKMWFLVRKCKKNETEEDRAMNRSIRRMNDSLSQGVPFTELIRRFAEKDKRDGVVLHDRFMGEPAPFVKIEDRWNTRGGVGG